MRFDNHENRIERCPLLTPFRISRGAKTEAVVITIHLEHDGIGGHGEGCAYHRYGETPG